MPISLRGNAKGKMDPNYPKVVMREKNASEENNLCATANLQLSASLLGQALSA